MSDTQWSQNSLHPGVQPPEVVTTLRSVRQDKSASTRDRIATPQPAPHKKSMRSHETNTNSSRSQKHLKKRKTVSLTLWVRPQLKAEIQRIAELEGLSLSQTGRAGLEEWVRQQLHIQHAVLLQPIIETAIRNELRRYFKQMVLFLARITLTLDVINGLVKWLCRRLAGATNAQIDIVEEQSRKEARLKLGQHSPQLEKATSELEKELATEGEGN